MPTHGIIDNRTEKRINRIVYGLTEEEIAIVEGETRLKKADTIKGNKP